MSAPSKKYLKGPTKATNSGSPLSLSALERHLQLIESCTTPIAMTTSGSIRLNKTFALFKRTGRQKWYQLLADRSADLRQSSLANCIDHTLLKPDTIESQIRKLTNECQTFQFAAACVPPNYLKLTASALKKSDTKPITVVGFPLGYQHHKVKLLEAKQALKDGALELDFVQDISLIKTKQHKALLACFQSWRKQTTLPIKVILETSLLTPLEIIECSAIAAWAKLDFVKTSTGFGSRGASIDDVLLMHIGLIAAELSNNKLTPHFTQIKASGGIKNSTDAYHYLALGVSRLGTSQSITIIGETDSKNPKTSKTKQEEPRY